jgi:hypothetical protein
MVQMQVLLPRSKPSSQKAIKWLLLSRFSLSTKTIASWQVELL